MNNNVRRFLHRKTTEDDIIYDFNTRNVYRNSSNPVQVTSQELYSLPTFDSRAPLKAYFDFSYLCNLECIHCITNSSPRVDTKNELPYERVISIMNELADVGVLELGVGGGEPMCHSKIISFLKHAQQRRLNVIMTTNGLLINSGVAERLRETHVSEVRISFDGSQSVHENIRGSGTYQKALKAVRILLHTGVKTVPRITICNDDESGIDSLFKDLDETGANTVKMGLLEPRGRASLKENQYLFRYNRSTHFGEIITDLAQKYNFNLQLPEDLSSCPETLDGLDLRRGEISSCGAGLETAYISPYGNVQPCSGQANYIFGNILSESFMSVWTNNEADTWRRTVIGGGCWRLCDALTST